MPFVVDASVSLAWGLKDEATPYADAVLRQAGVDDVWVPAIWVLEVANVILVSERRGRITGARSQAFLRQLQTLGVQVDRPELSTVWTSVILLARDHNLTVYDASYLELSLRLSLPLATQDNRLRTVAVRIGVSILAPYAADSTNGQEAT